MAGINFELTKLTDYSDEALVAEIRRVRLALGGAALTRDRFDKIARVHSSTLHRRFGSWHSALAKAGIKFSQPSRALTRDLVLNEIRKYSAESPKSPPTVREIAKRLGIDAGGITRRFGKWSLMLNDVGLVPAPAGRR